MFLGDVAKGLQLDGPYWVTFQFDLFRRKDEHRLELSHTLEVPRPYVDPLK